MKHNHSPEMRHKTPSANTIHTPQTYITISQAALNHNIAFYKNQIGQTSQLALVIKGNGYGHGLTEIGSLVATNPLVDWICVATLSEAVSLHNAGIQKPTLILGYADEDLTHALFKPYAFMVDSLAYAHDLNDIGKKYGYQFSVHLKIDTGLSRLGVLPEHAHSLCAALEKLPYVKIDGIFSHFIASDNNPELTQQQLNLFVNTINKLSLSERPILVHMSNTMATQSLEYPSLFNFFRVGLGLYGYGSTELIPALTWKTHVVSIKTVPAHSYVSYACTYKTTRATRIAVVPVGYSHGYQLRFSNKTSVLINNTLAPVIGRVGMNMTMIDVTDCIAHIGDEVILLGSTTGVRATDIAHTADIYNVREILTGISPSIQKFIL